MSVTWAEDVGIKGEAMLTEGLTDMVPRISKWALVTRGLLWGCADIYDNESSVSTTWTDDESAISTSWTVPTGGLYGDC